MKLPARNIVETNLSLKIISLILGTSFWLIFSATHTGSLRVDIPLSFYGNAENQDIAAPETIRIELAGKRHDLTALDFDTIALHINLDELQTGDNFINVDAEKLFLPNNVKLVHWTPSNPVITLTEKETITS